MKTQTAQLLKQHVKANLIKLSSVEGGVEVQLELSPEQVQEVVETEYGKSITQDHEKLLEVILKRLVKETIEHVKTKHNSSDSLSKL